MFNGASFPRVSIVYDFILAGVCLPGISVTGKSWGFDDLHARSLCVFGNACWIRLLQDLQELWWRKVEE